MPALPRSTWASLADPALLGQCEVDTYRASGPGGQHRNKTSSAVRLRHAPTGTLVIAEESRSQHENKAQALRRLRRAFYLHIRDEISPDAVATHPDFVDAKEKSGRLHMAAKNPRFWPAVGVVLDVLDALLGRVSEAAECLGISTGNLIDFLQVDDKVWQEANGVRARHGQKPLRPT